MEDIDSPDTQTWVAAQGQLSREFLDSISGRDSMTQRLRDIWNYERWTPPVRYGANWFFTHNDGLQNQAVVFVTKDLRVGEAGSARLLLDPNTLSADGTVALRERAISPDERLFAYALSEAGSDWQVLRGGGVPPRPALPGTLPKS